METKKHLSWRAVNGLLLSFLHIFQCSDHPYISQLLMDVAQMGLNLVRMEKLDRTSPIQRCWSLQIPTPFLINCYSQAEA